MPELPVARRTRYGEALGLSPYDAAVLVADPDATALFEATLAAGPAVTGAGGVVFGKPSLAGSGLAAKSVANWVTGEYLRLRKAAAGGDPVTVAPAELAAIIAAVDDGALSRANAKEVLEAHVATGHPAARIIEERGFRQISDAGAVGAAVDAALAANPAAVADYRAGKEQALGFLVGQVMKATRGQANAALVGAAVRERLDAK
jgi:aspartyl-tRNA(Asn)/glutamyl-tRNA(Gln) amidotransferase subunit B